MRKPKPYIDDEGEARELDDYFFENAKTGLPPSPSDRRNQNFMSLLGRGIVRRFGKDKLG